MINESHTYSLISQIYENDSLYTCTCIYVILENAPYVLLFIKLQYLGLIFLILGLQIFFQNIKVGGGEKNKN